MKHWKTENEKFLLDIQTKCGYITDKILNAAIDTEQTSKCKRPYDHTITNGFAPRCPPSWQQQQPVLWEQHLRLLSTSFMLQITIIIPCSIPRMINPSVAKSSKFHYITNELVWHKIGIFYRTDLKINPVWQPRSHLNPWPSSRHYLFLHWKLQDTSPYKLNMPPS